MKEQAKKQAKKGGDASASYLAYQYETIPNDDSAYPTVHIESALVTTGPVPWIYDSGCSQHISGLKADFAQLKRWPQNKLVRVAGGALLQAEGWSQVMLNDGFTLSEVWYVPEFKQMRLLSASALEKAGVRITLGNGEVVTHRNRVRLFRATSKNGLYLVEPGETVNITQTSKSWESSENSSDDDGDHFDSKRNKLNETDADLWHRRLGHTTGQGHRKAYIKIHWHEIQPKGTPQAKGEESMQRLSCGQEQGVL